MTRQARIAKQLLAVSYRTKLYHGTSLENAKKILRQGLKFGSGGDWSADGSEAVNVRGKRAVYLTGDFDLALRYAVGAYKNMEPVVLAVSISGEKKLKRFQVDPMDNPNDAWDDDSSDYHQSPLFVESVKEIPKDVLQLMRKIGVEIDDWNDERVFEKLFPDVYSDVEVVAYNGLNLLKPIRKFLLSKYRGDKHSFNLLFNKLKKLLPGDYEYYHIKRDGTVRFDEEFWKKVHQVKFIGKENKKVPTKAIKEVWVRKGYAEDNNLPFTEEKEVSLELLPSESREDVEKPKEFAEYVKSRFGGGYGSETMQDEMDAINLLDEIEEENFDDGLKEKLIALTKEAIEGFREDEEYEPEELLDEVGELTSYLEEETYESWGETRYEDESVMVKVRKLK